MRFEDLRAGMKVTMLSRDPDDWDYDPNEVYTITKVYKWPRKRWGETIYGRMHTTYEMVITNTDVLLMKPVIVNKPTQEVP